MSAMEFPAPGANAGITSQIAFKRALPRVWHNSSILCGFTMLGGVVAAFMSVCMILMVFSLLFAQGSMRAGNVIAALQWGLGAVVMLGMCPWLWSIGRAMAAYRVTFEPRGVTFNLGTKKKPYSMFLPWDEITAIKGGRVGNTQQFWVEAKDGSKATFSSYTFFRPRKVVGMIAERTGLAVQKLK